jgi:hypothetical protein
MLCLAAKPVPGCPYLKAFITLSTLLLTVACSCFIYIIFSFYYSLWKNSSFLVSKKTFSCFDAYEHIDD